MAVDFFSRSELGLVYILNWSNLGQIMAKPKCLALLVASLRGSSLILFPEFSGTPQQLNENRNAAVSNHHSQGESLQIVL